METTSGPRKSLHSTTTFVLVHLLAMTVARSVAVGPIVEISQGKVRGVSATTWRGRNITNFLGIPYAKPPTGDLRFERPVRASGWDGIYEANTDGPMCIQKMGDHLQGSEDCLFINVFTPQLPGEGQPELLPVMVYIFGGAFEHDSTTSIRYNGKYLLDEDIVLVVPSYRLGPFGFLSTGDHVVPGNNGFKDIVHAFKWVQENIRNFGGDPNRVTLVGHSSGAGTVHLLAMSRLMNGLFHRYIAQSGSALAFWAHASRDFYKEYAWKLGEYVGCPKNLSSIELITCLKGITATDLINTGPKLISIRLCTLSYPGVIWMSTDEVESDEAFLTRSPREILNDEGMANLPQMTGITRDDGLAFSACFYSEENLYEELLPRLDVVLPYLLIYNHRSFNQSAFTNELIAYYLNDLTVDKSVILSNLTTLIGDAFYIYPAWRALRQHVAQASSPTYFYTFNYLGTFSHTLRNCGSPEVFGVGHADELTYIFDEYEHMFSRLNKSLSPVDYDMTRKMVPMWASFIRDGTPSTSADPDAPIWTPYNTRDNNILRIGDGPSTDIQIENTFFEKRMRFWDELTDVFT